jgi:peptidoglycan/LPS O-acetylase OafA/YrhL
MPTSYSLPSRYLPAIDALRGLAFLMTFALHVGHHVPDGLPKLLHDVLGRGYAGVQLFFVVSALTLCRSLQGRNGEPAPLAAYAVRRLCRIAPMFWVAIALSLAANGWGPRWGAPDGISGGHVLLAALFLHGFDAVALNGVVPGGWSVAVEMQFYLLLPWVAAWAQSLRRALLLLGGSIALSLAALPALEAALAGLTPVLAHEAAYFSLPVQLPAFAAGVVLFRLLGPDRGAVRLPLPPRARAVVLVGLVLLVGLPLRWGGEGPELVPGAPGLVGYAVVLAVLAYALVTFPLPLLVNRVTRFMGEISYSAYLLHFLALGAVERALPALPPFPHLLALGAGALLVTVLAAMVSRRVVEVPGVALSRVLIPRLGSVRVAAAE